MHSNILGVWGANSSAWTRNQNSKMPGDHCTLLEVYKTWVDALALGCRVGAETSKHSMSIILLAGAIKIPRSTRPELKP